MTFTVSDALKVGKLRSAMVRAGAEGLGRTVASVNVMEVPDIHAWVKPHELLLTTLYPLRDTPGSLGTLVTELARQELAGIVVKTGRYFETIPEEMRLAAEEVGLPLIELRTSVSFDEIITELLSQILSVQTLRLQYSEEVHRRFTTLVLAGGGLPHIAENLEQLVGNPVMIIAPDRRILALSGLMEDEDTAFATYIHSEMGQRYLDLDISSGQQYGESSVMMLRRSLEIEERRIACYTCPIRVGTHNYGSIITLEIDRPFNDDDAVAMEHASTVSALAITKDQAILAVERKFQSDFLDDLLAGRITSLEIVASRSQTLGWNLARPCVVCVVEMHDDSEDKKELVARWQPSYTSDNSSVALLESARAAARHIDPEAIVIEKSGQLMFILSAVASKVNTVPKGEQRSPSTTARTGPLRTTTATLLPRSNTDGLRMFNNDVEMGQHLLRGLRFLQRERKFLLGMGRPCTSPLELHRSYYEACQAVIVGSQIHGAGPVIHFNDLGFQRILSQFENRAELHVFAEEQLGALEEYDRRHNTDLLLTLEMLLNCNLNMAVTARRLHLHYNSLRYRLQKIEELTGSFMEDAHHRINLELALQIRKLNR